MDNYSFQDVLGTSATISTVLQFLTGSVICHRYIRKKSTGETSGFPFVSGFLSCFLWLKYGMLTQEHVVIFVNIIGSVLFFSYVLVYFTFSINKRIVIRQFLGACVFIMLCTIYTTYESNKEKAVNVSGLVCCCVGVLFFASPFTKLAHWFIYGLLIEDKFIQVPNLLGCLLSAIQLMLYTVLSPQGKVHQRQHKPRVSQLETLEAKMASIEVSLSTATPRRRKGTSLGGGSLSARSSPRPDSAPSREPHHSALQDRETVFQNLRVQLGLGKLPRPTGPAFDDAERPGAEQRLAKLRTDAENKKIAISNLKSTLEKLDITDNIDTRIKQAELEYALGREELQLLSLVEEARALQARLDKSRPEANSLYGMLQAGMNLTLHAVQATP
ncbi:hypothetical protein pipiens_016630, partial [Culex pipiens pipiens]